MADGEHVYESPRMERPFSPATIEGHPCLCVVCGRTEHALRCISQYPFRYTPVGWSVEARTLALRCEECTRRRHRSTNFYDENEVWVYEEPNPYDNTQTGKFRVAWMKRAQHRIHAEEIHPDQEDKDMAKDDDGNDIQIRGGRGGAAPLIRETRSSRLKSQAKEVGGALGAGLQLAAANEAGEVLVDIAKELTSELPSMALVLEHPDGREIAKVLVALMLHTATSQTSVVPQGALIGKACKLQMTASSFTLLAPRLNQMRKHLTKLAKIGETIEGDYSEEEMAVADGEVAETLKSLKLRVAELEANEEVEFEEEVEETVEQGAES